MIAEYLDLQSLIMIRAARVGREIIKHKHFTLDRVHAPYAVPFSIGCDANAVFIVVAHEKLAGKEPTNIHVQVPVSLFEKGAPEDIADWVFCQNELEKARISSLDQAKIDEKKATEVQILLELAAKYPEIAANIASGG